MRPLQIQGRGIHKYRQQRDPDLQADLQSDLQKDLHLNLQDLQDLQADLQKDLQANLQMDLQVDLQVRMDLQPDLWVHTGLGATQISSLVSFPLQAETSTERENLGGTCEQGPNHVSGELPQIYNKDLHPTWIYKTHHITRSTPKQHPGNECSHTQSI